MKKEPSPGEKFINPADNETMFDIQEFKRNFYTYTFNKRKAEITKLNRTLGISLVFFAAISFFLIFNAFHYRADLQKNLMIKELAYQVALPAARPQNNSPWMLGDTGGQEALSGETPLELNPVIAALREEFDNEGIVAYLNIPQTNINYPVAQAEDNNYYLTRDLYGKTNAAGSIFLDFENSGGFDDSHTVIYGHNMGDGSMFHNLRYYEDQSYFKDHNIIELITPNGPTFWQAFSFFETSTDFNYIQVLFSSDREKLSLFNLLQEHSIHESNLEINDELFVLTLSTCTNRPSDTRFVLSAYRIN